MPMFWHSDSWMPLPNFQSLSLVYSSRVSIIHRQACWRTAGPRYPSGCHQQLGQEVVQQAHITHSQSPSSFFLSTTLMQYSLVPAGLGFFLLRKGQIVAYWAQKLVRSTTKSFRTNKCPRGVTIAGFVRSVSMALIQAKVCRPSQFMAQEPQIPSLHDLLNDRVGSRQSLTQRRASRYMGGTFLRSTQQLTQRGFSLASLGLYLQIRNCFMDAFSSEVRLGLCSSMELGLRYPFMLLVTLSKKFFFLSEKRLRGARRLPKRRENIIVIFIMTSFLTVRAIYCTQFNGAHSDDTFTLLSENTTSFSLILCQSHLICYIIMVGPCQSPECSESCTSSRQSCPPECWADTKGWGQGALWGRSCQQERTHPKDGYRRMSSEDYQRAFPEECGHGRLTEPAGSTRG